MSKHKGRSGRSGYSGIRLTINNMERRKEKLLKRLNRLYQEVLKTDEVIKLMTESLGITKESPNALLSTGTEGSTGQGTTEGQGAGGNELPVLESTPQVLVGGGEPEVQNNPPSTES